MTARIEAFGISIDPVTMGEAVDVCIDYSQARTRNVPFVVTPNLDHVVMLQENQQFRSAYNQAVLSVVDGKPVRKSLRWLGCDIPEVVPGSDLVPAIFDKIASGDRSFSVFLLGAAPGVAEKAATHIEARWKNVTVVDCYSPPFGFENDEVENARITAKINKARPDILVIGLGAPKQELWAYKHSGKLDVGIALCVGATIDFLAGEKSRAPVWMRSLAIEWLHRMLSEPRRLCMRYLRGAAAFPGIVLKERRIHRKDHSVPISFRH